MGLNSPAVTAWTVDLGRPEHRGRALASMYIAMEAGIGLGAYFSAFIYNNHATNFPVTFYIFAGITLMATLYLSFIYKPRKAADAIPLTSASAMPVAGITVICSSSSGNDKFMPPDLPSNLLAALSYYQAPVCAFFRHGLRDCCHSRWKAYS